MWGVFVETQQGIYKLRKIPSHQMALVMMSGRWHQEVIQCQAMMRVATMGVEDGGEAEYENVRVDALWVGLATLQGAERC